jgi:hypothetical protein
VVLSNIVPTWYHHRFNSDVKLLSQRLMGMLDTKARERVCTAAQLALTASTSAISVSASALTSENAVMAPLPSSAVVPSYAPMAAAMRRVAGLLCGRRSRAEEEEKPAPTSNKKARRD